MYKINNNKKDREILFSVTKKDFNIDWFSGTGNGGQYRNRHPNCCRLRHPDSGAEATGTESRSRDDNLRTAFKRIVETDIFKSWIRKKASEKMLSSDEKRRMQEEIERWVDDQMREENLKIEYL